MLKGVTCDVELWCGTSWASGMRWGMCVCVLCNWTIHARGHCHRASDYMCDVKYGRDGTVCNLHQLWVGGSGE